MTIIASKRNEQLAKQEDAVIGYLLAGYPSQSQFMELLHAVEKTALDALEIGYPSQNPYADGEIIKAAHLGVDHARACDLDYWRQIRETVSKPIWLMAYRDDFIADGTYVEFAQEQIMDAIVIPDCTHEEHVRLGKSLQHQVDVIRFIRPTMSQDEIKRIAANPALSMALYNGPTGVPPKSKRATSPCWKQYCDIHLPVSMLDSVLTGVTRSRSFWGRDSMAQFGHRLDQGLINPLGSRSATFTISRGRKMKCVVTFDIGTTAVKGVLVSSAGEVLYCRVRRSTPSITGIIGSRIPGSGMICSAVSPARSSAQNVRARILLVSL